MNRSTIIVLCAVALGAGALAGCGGSDEESAAGGDTQAATTAAAAGGGSAQPGDTLDGTVGPEATIELTYDGQPVTELPAGSYTIAVDDQATSHNFHLAGPGVEETTAVAETGTATWTVELQAGEYTFVCDPHASQMNGTVAVG